jgi:23S rRNA (adenine2503-C2)-methyltransferase
MSQRYDRFQERFPSQPTFRWTQVEEALYRPEVLGWMDMKNVPKEIREVCEREIPWMSVSAKTVMVSKRGDTHKALLTLHDGKEVESVLMENARGDWTICVSSQVGCAMRCAFCATGKMGLTRNLDSDEIADQYRFWINYMRVCGPETLRTSRISNVVFMGMGEPLANYENVKVAINTWLKRTDLGPTHITVSTVGVLPRLEQILTDATWPHTRIAISLHSAVATTRKEIVPASYDDFLPKLEDWAHRYQEVLGNRRHHLTFEYVMLKNVNDTEAHAKTLAAFCSRIGDVRVNLIPYNFTDSEFTCSEDAAITRFLEILEHAGVISTRRKTMGEDIAAACGQLIVLNKKPMGNE